MNQQMSAGMAWVFGLGTAVVASLAGYLIVSAGTLGTLGLFAIIFAIGAVLAVKKTRMSKGGVVGTFIACAVIACIGLFMTTSSTLAAEVAAEVAKSPELNGGEVVNETAANAAGGLAGALVTVGGFVAALLGSVLGGLIPSKS